MNNKRVRVRFAPSPTGALHLGGVRTALFNYLFARRHGGDFLLRVEDTDQGRFVPGAEEYIIEALKWCGLTIDEGVSVGGPHAPYRQSERSEIYRQFTTRLVAEGRAYLAFDPPGELNERRAEAEARGDAFIYGAKNRDSLRNSLALPAEEVERLLQAGEKPVIRFKMPADEEIILQDIIRGEVRFNTSLLDDKVLFKADGMPTYHLANVVDDHLMEISHVIRGEEWLPSFPLHALLYRALGWEKNMPLFAHLPLILKPVGNGKLSKRDGNKMGFPVFPMEFTDPVTGEKWRGYKEDGYFPEAFVNMLALLGWNPGTEQELFSLQELSEAFSLERVNRSGARFSPEKARWFNHKYLQEKPDEVLAAGLARLLEAEGTRREEQELVKICRLLKERANFVQDIHAAARFFFHPPRVYDEKGTRKNWKEETPALLGELARLLEEIEPFIPSNTEPAVREWVTGKGVGLGQIMNAFRLAITGFADGPRLFDVIEILGKEETTRRLAVAIERLSSNT
ncbi:MAG: glutamate--tRNA ligase [Odoribacteraceae bacterium]|jgi:glutamyl-tRNA synthetase|nr:glutamate--tRNA ligase [Odoribacteraceae bacterium]